MLCRGGNNHPIWACDGSHVPGTLLKQIIGLWNLAELVENQEIIIFYTNYRGSKKSEGDDEFGGDDINDIINLYPIIKRYKYSDENKISLFGWSRGCMSAMLVLKKVDWVKSVILGAGVYDYKIEKKERPEFYKFLKKHFNFSKKTFEDRSAINWIYKIPKIPILLLHGTSDGRVSVKNPLQLSIELYNNKIPYKLVIYPGGTHSLKEYKLDVKKEIQRYTPCAANMVSSSSSCCRAPRCWHRGHLVVAGA